MNSAIFPLAVNKVINTGVCSHRRMRRDSSAISHAGDAKKEGKKSYMSFTIQAVYEPLKNGQAHIQPCKPFTEKEFYFFRGKNPI
jgi:hypothetical protein